MTSVLLKWWFYACQLCMKSKTFTTFGSSQKTTAALWSRAARDGALLMGTVTALCCCCCCSKELHLFPWRKMKPVTECLLISPPGNSRHIKCELHVLQRRRQNKRHLLSFVCGWIQTAADVNLCITHQLAAGKFNTKWLQVFGCTNGMIFIYVKMFCSLTSPSTLLLIFHTGRQEMRKNVNNISFLVLYCISEWFHFFPPLYCYLVN